MRRFARSMRLWGAAWTWLLTCVGTAGAEHDPVDFADRWIVVLASHKSPDAARKAAQQRSPPAAILVSDEFSALSPGYSLVVLGPFDSRAQARRALEASGAKGAYPKFTGMRRCSASREASASPSASSAQHPPQVSCPPCKTHRCWDDDALTGPEIAALEVWEKREGHEPGRTAYEILDVYDSGPLGALMIYERERAGARCEQGYRELRLTVGPTGPTVSKGRLLGHRCCKRTACERHAPSSLMMELVDHYVDIAWAISPKRGVIVHSRDGSSRTYRFSEASERLLAFTSFDPRYDTFECPESWTAGVAQCMKSRGGEGYDFTWREMPDGTWLESVNVLYQE
jgi:hypothetical protein